MSAVDAMGFNGSVPRAKENVLILVRVLSGYRLGEFVYHDLPEDAVDYDGDKLRVKNVKWEDLDKLTAAAGESLSLKSTKKKIKVQTAINEVFKFLGAKNDQNQLIFASIYKSHDTKGVGIRRFDFVLPKSPLKDKEAIRDNERWLSKKLDELWGVEPEQQTGLDWRRICEGQFRKQSELFMQRRSLLDRQRELEVFVPLGLVQPKKETPKAPAEFRDEMGLTGQERQAEIEKTFEHETFLTEIVGQSAKSVAIIGEPGAGKSTWLQKVGEFLLGRADLPSPIFVPLSLLQGQSLEHYLCGAWLDEALGKEPTTGEEKAFKDWVRQGGAVLLLDGLDEMRGNGADLRGDLQGWLGAVRVFVSCRLNAWDLARSGLPTFEQFRTLAFTDEQVKVFVGQWFRGEVARGTELLRHLGESRHGRLRDLVRNPLRLVMLCGTWQDGAAFPETKADLYGAFVRLTYSWKRIEFQFSDHEQIALNQALGELARRMIEEERLLNQTWIIKVLGNNLWELAKKLGWLNLIGEGKNKEPIYAFFHWTFAEYFAACVIEDWDYFLPRNHGDRPIPNHPYRIFAEKWKEVYWFWLGRNDVADQDKESLIHKLVKFKDGCGDSDLVRYQAYWRAAQGIAEFKTCSLANEIIAQVVKCALGYWDTEKERWVTFLKPLADDARTVIEETDRQKAIAALFDLCKTAQNEKTRREAAERLGKIDPSNKEAIAALAPLCKNVQDESTHCCAAESLVKIDSSNEEAITALVDLCKNAQSEWIRRNAAESLVKIDSSNKKAITTLVDLCKTAQDDWTRWQAVRSLEQISTGNNDVIAALIDISKTAQDEDIRQKAVESLGQIEPSNKDALVDPCKTSQSGWTHSNAVENLGEILKTTEGCQRTISIFQPYLTDEMFENCRGIFSDSFDVLNHCAKNLSYTDFYTAWHQSPTLHPETPKQRHLIRQNLPAHLPPVPHGKIYTLDYSQISDPANPALDYYDQLEAQGFPTADSDPDSFPKLKRHWNKTQRNQDHPDYLILYPSQGQTELNPDHLQILSQFTGHLAAITTTKSEHLQTFDPADPHLLDNLQKWIERSNLEK